MFEFLRNSKMDSNNFFANRSGVPLGSYKRNQFGATVMGPISIPKLYNGKNRSFFLFAYEGLRERSAANQQTTVPTALQRAGDFSQTFNGGGQLVQIFDPTTTVQSGSVRSREAFVGNLIPASRVNPVSRNLMGFYPQPNRQGDGAAGTNNWVSAGSAQVDINKWESKWDQVINDGNRFFLRVSRRKMLRNPTLFLPDEIAVANGGAFQPTGFDWSGFRLHLDGQPDPTSQCPRRAQPNAAVLEAAQLRLRPGQPRHAELHPRRG